MRHSLQLLYTVTVSLLCELSPLIGQAEAQEILGFIQVDASVSLSESPEKKIDIATARAIVFVDDQTVRLVNFCDDIPGVLECPEGEISMDMNIERSARTDDESKKQLAFRLEKNGNAIDLTINRLAKDKESDGFRVVVFYDKWFGLARGTKMLERFVPMT